MRWRTAEALAWLVLASIMIRCIPFRRLGPVVAGRARQAIAPSPAIAAVAQAIDRATPRLPWRTKCFERGVAAQLMLRARGYAATLYFGARHEADGQLIAHVWVRSGTADVLGCEDGRRFAVLARYPAATTRDN